MTWSPNGNFIWTAEQNDLRGIFFALLAAMRAHEYGREAAIIGRGDRSEGDRLTPIILQGNVDAQPSAANSVSFGPTCHTEGTAT